MTGPDCPASSKILYVLHMFVKWVTGYGPQGARKSPPMGGPCGSAGVEARSWIAPSGVRCRGVGSVSRRVGDSPSADLVHVVRHGSRGLLRIPAGHRLEHGLVLSDGLLGVGDAHSTEQPEPLDLSP